MAIGMGNDCQLGTKTLPRTQGPGTEAASAAWRGGGKQEGWAPDGGWEKESK